MQSYINDILHLINQWSRKQKYENAIVQFKIQNNVIIMQDMASCCDVTCNSQVCHTIHWVQTTPSHGPGQHVRFDPLGIACVPGGHLTGWWECVSCRDLNVNSLGGNT